MQVSSTSPFSPIAVSYNAATSPAAAQSPIVPEAQGEIPEKSHGDFYDSWPTEAKAVYKALEKEDKIRASLYMATMEFTYTTRLAAKGKNIDPDTIDEIMAEARRIQETKAYTPLSTMEGFNTMMKEIIDAVDVPGGDQKSIDFYKTLFNMANCGYQSLDLEA